MTGGNADPVYRALTRPAAPEDLLPDGQRRCKATASNSGERCKRAVSPGSLVCATHGGRAPQVQAKARLRLAELVDPAVGVLAREMVSEKNKPGDRIRAAENILDRAGYGRQIDNGNVELARAILINKLVAVQAARREEPNVIDGETIEDELL